MDSSTLIIAGLSVAVVVPILIAIFAANRAARDRSAAVIEARLAEHKAVVA